MVIYLKYSGDSCVGYDDAETYELKEEYANNGCLVYHLHTMLNAEILIMIYREAS
jgi:hypothetical protein